MTTRKITTYYAQTDESDATITVTVEQEDRFTATVCDDLDDLGVPTDEQPGLRLRVIEQFWQAERAAWVRANPDAE